MAKKKLSSIGLSLKSGELINHNNPIFKKELNEKLKDNISKALDADEELTKVITSLNLDVGINKDKSLNQVIEGIQGKVDSKHEKVISNYLSNPKPEEMSSKVGEVFGLGLEPSKNPLLADPITKYNSTKLGKVLKIGNLSIEEELPFLLKSSLDQRASLIDQWAAEKKISVEEKTKLENALGLMHATEGKVDIFTAMWNEGIQKKEDLAKHHSSSIIDILKNKNLGSTDVKENEAFAEKVIWQAEKENPSAFFLYRLIEKQEWLGLDPTDLPKVSNGLKDFYKNNSQFDLKKEPIISLETGLLNAKIKGITPSPSLVEELSLAQQVLKISPDSTIAALLMAKKVTIHKAATSTHRSLMRETGIDALTAVQIKKNAQNYHDIAMNGFLAYRDNYSNPFARNVLTNLKPINDQIRSDLGDERNWGEIQKTNGLKGLNSIEDLFGSQNYCECDSCQSVLSPAAYFVDLMRFVEGRVLKSTTTPTNIFTETILEDTNPIHLKVRRPDLWNLKLTCENTNKRVPYIEIINEVLTSFVQKHLVNSKTISQRLIKEAPDMEFSLPYNKSLDEVRTWLSYFNLQRIDLLEYLYPTPNQTQELNIALERLNLSNETFVFIIDENLNAKIDKDVLLFRINSGLSAEDTDRLIELKFWNNQLRINKIKDNSDIQKFKLEFESKLHNWEGMMHRVLRLWKASGWTLVELDTVFQTFDITYKNLDKKAIVNLAGFKKLQSLLDFSVEIVSGLLKGLQQVNSPNRNLTWEQILPRTWTNDIIVKLDDLYASVDDKAVKLLLELQGIFGVTTSDILACLSLLRDKLGSDITFGYNTLNHIFRYIQIFKWSKAGSFEQFSQLLKVWGKGTVRFFESPLQDIPSFVSFIKNVDLSLDSLLYVFGEDFRTTSVILKDRLALESDEIREFIVTDDFKKPEQYELLFNKWLGIEIGLLNYFKHFLELSDTDLETLFDDFVKDRPTDTTYIALSNIKNRLERLKFLFENFKIDADSQEKILEEGKSCKYLKFGFTNWEKLDWVRELSNLSKWIAETKSLRNFELFEILRIIEKDPVLPTYVQKSIAKWQKVTLAQIHSDVKQTSSITEIQGIWDRFSWSKRLNMSTKLLEKFKHGNDFGLQSELIQNAIRSKFEKSEDYEASIEVSKNKLSSNLRDALCNFVIFNKELRGINFGFSDRKSLYQYFLIDVNMGDCFTVPRIVAATNSLQVFIHRCIMGLEISADEKTKISLDLDEVQEWEWRKNYRVWEANRKIFLFPENYAEAGIRDNKSPEFKELEDELLQQKLNSEVVENAYKKYLEQVMTLAELRIAGAYFDKGNNQIYLFGKTNKQPHEFYYRSIEFLESGGVVWSNWEKMNLTISAEDVSAIRHNGKLHVFWTSYQRKDISNISEGKSTIAQHTYDIFLNYSFLKIDKTWSSPQRIDMGYRTNSPYDPFLRINDYKTNIINPETSNPSFGPNAEFIRENALKQFEQTVYRKPYPSLGNNTNTLNFNYIWTDKMAALEPRYKKTRAIVNPFNVSVPIIIKISGYINAELERNFNYEFKRIIKEFSPANSNQISAPNNLNFSDEIITMDTGAGDKLAFIMEFRKQGSGYKYFLKTQNSAGNTQFFFKNPDTEIKSGDVEIDHQIDYISVEQIQFQSETVNMVQQKKISSKVGSPTLLTKLNPEFNSYFDNFFDFYVGDGSNDFAIGDNDYKVQQLERVAILKTPGNHDLNEGYNLNPENTHMLWDKISIGLEAFLDTQSTQRDLADQIDYSQCFGNYYFELFFHIPMLIADHLNASGKYREADYWYRFIYNPTAIKDRFEELAFPQDVNWRFAAFRNVGIQKLKDIYNNPNAIEMYRRNPGNPHAIARLRIGAYQKHVVMKYLDNLMDWADNLFEQFTPESTGEARNLYGVVETILGNKPQKTGKCSDSKEFTYKDINNSTSNEFIYNLFATETPANLVNEFNFQNGATTGMETELIPGFLNYSIGIPIKYSSKGNKILNSGFNKISTTAPTSKIGEQKTTNLSEITTDSRVQSLRPNKDLMRPSFPLSFLNLETDLAFCFPHNKDFINYWDRVADRIFNLNNCLDINGIKKVMPAYAPEIDPMLLARMVAGGLTFDEISSALNSKLPNHRFTYLIEKAKQYVGVVQSFGQALFTAIEKKDSEELTLLRAMHEQNILTLTSQVKRQQLEQAKTSLNVLLENKKGIEIRKAHYEGLIETGLTIWERTEQISKWTSGGIRTAEATSHLVGSIMGLVPDVGSPFCMKYGGTQLSENFQQAGQALEATAKIADNVAILAGLEGGNQRKEQEWQFQVKNTAQELIGIDVQIRNAEIQVQLADFDLSLHLTNIEQYKELYEFYTTKFSNLNHYTFQVKQLQQLYRMSFNLAHDLSLEAQKAFIFERFGVENIETGFIKSDNWNNEKLGVLSGERLMLQLMKLESKFIETDIRKLELKQQFSMMQLAPDKLLELKVNGECIDFTIPEAAYDLTNPGEFRRIIKSVSISIPCISGPYTSIGAKLTLGNNKIRLKTGEEPVDFNFNGCKIIATSHAQNDGGQFELNFRDERYLPFEGAGAVSSWTLSLPKIVRPFDYNTISDVIFHVSYTAEFDGTFKDAVETSLKTVLNSLNGIGLSRVFSMRHDFPLELNKLNTAGNSADVIFELSKAHFPYFAVVDNIKSIGAKVYTIDATNVLSEEADNLGIKKQEKMKILIPASVGSRSLRDVIFFVTYDCS